MDGVFSWMIVVIGALSDISSRLRYLVSDHRLISSENCTREMTKARYFRRKRNYHSWKSLQF